MQSSPFDQPVDLEIYSGVDEAVEMAVGVFEAKRIRIGKVGRDLKVKFCWEVHERDLMIFDFRHSLRLELWGHDRFFHLESEKERAKFGKL